MSLPPIPDRTTLKEMIAAAIFDYEDGEDHYTRPNEEDCHAIAERIIPLMDRFLRDGIPNRATLLDRCLLAMWKASTDNEGDLMHAVGLSKQIVRELEIDGLGPDGVTVDGLPLVIPFDNPLSEGGAVVYREPGKLVRVADVAAMNIVPGWRPTGRYFVDPPKTVTRVVLRGGEVIFFTESAFIAISELMAAMDDGS